MTSPAQAIRTIVENTMTPEPEMTCLMAALANRHGGGGLERQAKPNGQMRFEDGEVRSGNDLIKTMSGHMRKLMKSLDVDPAVSNAAVVGFRTADGIRTSILMVHPGDIEKGEFTSFLATTEAEWFEIANSTNRFPYSKMPQPVGTIIEIKADDSLGEPVRLAPPQLEWVDLPLDWNAVAGLPPEMRLPYDTSKTPDADTSERGLPPMIDPFCTDVWNAIGMQPPGIRDIRRIGVPNGFRDERENVVE